MSDGMTLFQVSLLQALCQRDYEGHLPISELKRHGDIGLGTFDPRAR
ncbi:MAG: acetolactate decarboxylase [Thermoplasmata archaeon]|nr:acetolactate decarboxylase [Thermoplasmata archaeon]